MARVKIEDIVESLDSEMKRALERAVGRACPEARVDRNQLFREFRKAVRAKCRTWEQVPDDCVDID